MDMDYLLKLVIDNGPSVIHFVVMALGSLVVIGSSVVALTPNKDDDAKLDALLAKPIIGPLLKALIKFSPFVKK